MMAPTAPSRTWLRRAFVLRRNGRVPITSRAGSRERCPGDASLLLSRVKHAPCATKEAPLSSPRAPRQRGSRVAQHAYNRRPGAGTMAVVVGAKPTDSLTGRGDFGPTLG